MANDKIKFSTGTVVDSSGNLYQAGSQITATATEINYAADASGYAQQELNASGAITPGVRNFVFAATAVPTASIAATIADASAHAGLFTAVQSTTDTVGHTIIIASGSFDGTNNKATFNAAAEALIVSFDSSGNGRIVLNSGSVALAAT